MRSVLVFLLTALLGGSNSLLSQVITPVTATASSYYSAEQVPNNLINGSGLLGGGPVLTRTHDKNSNAQGMWHSSGGTVNGSWVIFDLGAQYSLTGADIWQLNQSGNLGRGVKSFGIYTSANGADPITNFVGGFTLNKGSGTTNEARQFIPVSAACARQVMFVITNDWNGLASDYVGLSEVRFEGSLFKPIDPPITNGLFGYWKFDEANGSIASDSSGNGNFGTIYNTFGNMGQWTSSGIVGGALHFRGTGFGNDYVSISNVPGSASNSMTLSAWIQVDTNQTGALVGTVENSAQLLTFAPDSTPLPQASWQHVVMVMAGGNISVYRDGLRAASASYDSTLFHAPDTLLLGAHRDDNGSLGAYLQGSLDEVACWTRPLQADEVFKLFAAGRNGAAVTQSDSFSNSPPIIMSAPQGGVYYAHEPLSLAVDVSGFGTLHYQWFKDGLLLPSQNYRVFTNPSADFDAAGQYVAVASDGNGRSAMSEPITVSVGLPSVTIEPVANGINIAWPAAAAGYQLESAPALNGPWSVVPYSTTNSIILPATNSSYFYRLGRD